MARRRRRRWRKVKPDMGWLIDTSVLQVNASNLGGGEAAGIAGTVVLSFDDIDSDEALITQDKSDWFIKRVIVDAYPTLFRGSSATSPPTRLWEMGIGTMDASEFTEFVVGDSVIDATTYERWRRLFKTYTRPVYATATYTIDANGDLVTQDGGTATENVVVDSPYGPSCVQDDFTVSNAGLVQNSNMYIVCSTSDIISGSYHWIVGEQLYVGLTTRVLLQKRRT